MFSDMPRPNGGEGSKKYNVDSLLNLIDGISNNDSFTTSKNFTLPFDGNFVVFAVATGVSANPTSDSFTFTCSQNDTSLTPVKIYSDPLTNAYGVTIYTKNINGIKGDVISTKTTGTNRSGSTVVVALFETHASYNFENNFTEYSETVKGNVVLDYTVLTSNCQFGFAIFRGLTSLDLKSVIKAEYTFTNLETLTIERLPVKYISIMTSGNYTNYIGILTLTDIPNTLSIKYTLTNQNSYGVDKLLFF